MTLREQIDHHLILIGRGSLTDPGKREARIELQAYFDIWEGNPYNEDRWNITEAYIYRVAYAHGRTLLHQEVLR